MGLTTSERGVTVSPPFRSGGWKRKRRRRRLARPVLPVPADLGGKHGQCTAHKTNRPVRMVTRPPTLDHAPPAAQLLSPPLTPIAGDEGLNRLGDRWQPLSTGP